jgi:hypothetical protein
MEYAEWQVLLQKILSSEHESRNFQVFPPFSPLRELTEIS